MISQIVRRLVSAIPVLVLVGVIVLLDSASMAFGARTSGQVP